MRIIVATHNEGKLVEINRILEDCLGADAAQVELVSAGSLNLPDPVEDGVTFQENALLKARDVAARTGCPAIADDSGLIVDVMGNAPGILSARWSGKHGDDEANNALLLAQISDIPDAKRTARSVARPHWWCRKPKLAPVPTAVMRLPARLWKSAKCRACCCMNLMASMASDMIHCLCPTISPLAPRKRAKNSLPRRWNRTKRTLFPTAAKPCALCCHPWPPC